MVAALALPAAVKGFWSMREPEAQRNFAVAEKTALLILCLQNKFDCESGEVPLSISAYQIVMNTVRALEDDFTSGRQLLSHAKVLHWW